MMLWNLNELLNNSLLTNKVTSNFYHNFIYAKQNLITDNKVQFNLPYFSPNHLASIFTSIHVTEKLILNLAEKIQLYFKLPSTEIIITNNRSFVGYMDLKIQYDEQHSWKIYNPKLLLSKWFLDSISILLVESLLVHEFAHFYQIFHYGFWLHRCHDEHFYNILNSYHPIFKIIEYIWQYGEYNSNIDSYNTKLGNMLYNNKDWLRNNQLKAKLITEKQKSPLIPKYIQSNLNIRKQKINELKRLRNL